MVGWAREGLREQLRECQRLVYTLRERLATRVNRSTVGRGRRRVRWGPVVATRGPSGCGFGVLHGRGVARGGRRLAVVRIPDWRDAGADRRGGGDGLVGSGPDAAPGRRRRPLAKRRALRALRLFPISYMVLAVHGAPESESTAILLTGGAEGDCHAAISAPNCVGPADHSSRRVPGDWAGARGVIPGEL